MLLFCGCVRQDPDSTSYHIYSEGTFIEVESGSEEYAKKTDEAEFYVPDGMVTDYLSKNTLDDKEKELYDRILKDLGSLKERAPLTVDAEIYVRLLNLILLERLSYTQVSDWEWEYNTDNQGLDIVFVYRFTADQISSMNIAAERAAKEIMKGVTPDMDDYEKVKYFHDYLVLNCTANTDYEYADTIYGALVQKEAMCEGYTKAFSYLCNLAGIENVIVAGETYVPHVWNMVKLGGNWYHVDVTWDDPDDKLHEAFPDVILYQYFMVTDSVIENNHLIWSYPAEFPKANGRNENYFVREGTDITNAEEFLTVSENAIMGAVSRGEQSAMVKFETNDLYISTVSDLAERSINDVFEAMLSRIGATYGKDIKLSWTDYYGQYRILTFIIEYN